jgi:hypothetical protein
VPPRLKSNIDVRFDSCHGAASRGPTADGPTLRSSNSDRKDGIIRIWAMIKMVPEQLFAWCLNIGANSVRRTTGGKIGKPTSIEDGATMTNSNRTLGETDNDIELTDEQNVSGGYVRKASGDPLDYLQYDL